MSARPTLNAEERTVIGKQVKRLRRAGKVPGIIYGTLVDNPIPVTVDERELNRTYIDYGNSSLIDVHIDGDVHTVYIRDVQQDPISRIPLHTELFAPNLLVSMTASIPIILIGESQNLDAVVTQLRDSIDAEGLPTDLPGALEVDVSGLVEIDDTVWVGDLEMPDGVELITDEEEPIVRLMEVRIEVEEEEIDAELEGEEGVEGEEGEGAAEDAEGDSEEA